MELLLHKEKKYNFFVSDTFTSNMLVPVIKNLLYKAENEWDDYDEIYHCCHLIETVKQNPNIIMDFHYIKKDDDIIGVGLMSHGILDIPLFFPDMIHISEPTDNILVFNYFHISPEDRGNGGYWLRDIIIPYYYGKKFKSIYVKSSHSRVFNLYNRLGKCIGEYISKSDNRLYERLGKMFRISLEK